MPTDAAPEILPRLTLRVGDVLSRLREIPSGSVQCVITSPPYWGLRDYGIAPVVWAPVRYAPLPGLPEFSVPDRPVSRDFLSCTHHWEMWTESHDVRETPICGKTRTTERCYGGAASRKFDGNHQKHRHGQFCVQCGAWRGCLGHEPSPDLYIGHLVQVFREIRRVLRPDGTLWLNLGDSYSGSGKGMNPSDSPHQKQARNRGSVRNTGKVDAGTGMKQMLGIPWRAALALQADGWTLRSDIVWAKGASFARTWHGNPMPESVRDRPSRAHETIFLLSPSPRYFYDHVAVQEPAAQPHSRAPRQGDDRRPILRNLRDVWAITTKPFKGAHFATFPPDLVEPMIRAGTPQAGRCPRCGAPWRRETRRGSPVYTGGASRAVTQAREHASLSRQGVNGALSTGVHYLRETLGWRPGCACPEHDPVPADVLDPFFGAGTTGLVALALGRSALGIEANPEYAALALARIGAAVPGGRKTRVAPGPSAQERATGEAGA